MYFIYFYIFLYIFICKYYIKNTSMFDCWRMNRQSAPSLPPHSEEFCATAQCTDCRCNMSQKVFNGVKYRRSVAFFLILHPLLQFTKLLQLIYETPSLSLDIDRVLLLSGSTSEVFCLLERKTKCCPSCASSSSSLPLLWSSLSSSLSVS